MDIDHVDHGIGPEVHAAELLLGMSGGAMIPWPDDQGLVSGAG